MVYKRNTIFLVLRLLVILAVMMAIPLATEYIERNQLVFTYIVIIIVLTILVYELIRFTNRTNRELSGFLEHILNRDFSLRFNTEQSRGARKELYNKFNEVLKIYEEIRMDQEVQFRFLEHIVELIEVGIIVRDNENKVVLMNSAAGHLAGISTIETWEQMREKNRDFAEAIDQIEDSGKTLFESSREGEKIQQVIHVNHTQMLDEPYTLITFHDIGSLMEEKETGAWTKLLRTLNHEIKNSVTPISSLTDTIMMILRDEHGKPKKPHEISSQNVTDILTSLETLQQRSENLYNFINEYQKLARIPAPNPEIIELKPFLEDVHAIFKSDLDKKNIVFRLEIKDCDTGINADPRQVQQLLINLVKNSMEALENTKNAMVTVSCQSIDGGTEIVISDNGEGIDQDIMDDIFVPFFTTKKAGSGIGLSMARQIMRLHGGNVRIESKKGYGTKVYLDFREKV